MKALKQHIDAACEAQAHLYVFAGLVGTLEAGTIRGGGSANKTAKKIINLCKAEMTRQYRIKEYAIEAAHGIKGDA